MGTSGGSGTGAAPPPADGAGLERGRLSGILTGSELGKSSGLGSGESGVDCKELIREIGQISIWI